MFARKLDISEFPQKSGQSLHTAIIQAVKDTQRLVIQELPSELHMSRDQFDILQTNPELQGLYDSKEFIYYTPEAIMEVRVKPLL